MTSLINADADPMTLDWFGAGTVFALATVVEANGSAPLPVGTTMAVGPGNVALGTVSAGCVDGAIFESACAVRDSGHSRIESFGYSDSDAFAVGLTCGGTITVLVQPVSRYTFPHYDSLLDRCMADDPVAWATGFPSPSGTAAQLLWTPDAPPTGSLRTSTWAVDAAKSMLESGRSGICFDTTEPEARLFVRSLTAPHRLVIVGATEHAAALSKLAHHMGFHVTVCDARPVFANPVRFPDADEVICDWPQRYLASTRIDGTTAVCVLTHDAKFDVPAVLTALSTNAGYIGAMGSLRTHHDRRRRLVEAGATSEMLHRLRSPIGLDLGGKSPQEIAIAILAELTAVRHGRTGRPLTRTGTESAPHTTATVHNQSTDVHTKAIASSSKSIP